MTLFAAILESLSRARRNFHRPYKASCEIASRVSKTESELRTLNLHVKVGQLGWLVKYLNPWSTSLNSLWGVSPSLGSWIWVSAAIQDLDHNNNRELVSRVLTCSHIGFLSFVCPMLLYFTGFFRWFGCEGWSRAGEQRPQAQLCILSDPMKPELFITQTAALHSLSLHPGSLSRPTFKQRHLFSFDFQPSHPCTGLHRKWGLVLVHLGLLLHSSAYVYENFTLQV